MSKAFFTIFIICLFSCSEKYKPQDGEIKVSIEHSNGDTFMYESEKGEQFFLPYPVNEGSGRLKDKSRQFAIIGEQIQSGDDLYVVPIARLRYTANEELHEVILGIPAEKKYRTMEITGYSDLNTEYYGAKQILDYWYTNRYGLGTVTNVRWSPI